MKYSSYIVTTLALSGYTFARPDGVGGHHDHGGHHADHGAVAAPAPATGYQEPLSGYEAQVDPGYSAPASGYGAPSTGYGAPSSGYGAPSGPSGYENFDQTAPAEQGGLDLSTLLIPILIIAGLALLFPSVTSVAVRKRREAGGELHKQLHIHNIRKTKHTAHYKPILSSNKNKKIKNTWAIGEAGLSAKEISKSQEN